MKRTITRLAVGIVAASFLGSCGSSGSSPSDPPPPAAQPAGTRPNLIVDAQALQDSVLLDQQDFQATDCEVVEGCVAAAGTRRLLRFDGDIINIGNQDLVLGNPGTNPNFQFDTCHMHYHLENMMQFALINPTTGAVVKVGNSALVARKQGFCLEDVNPYSPTAGPAKYDCTYQGISAGWEDVYEASLDCQWLDITGVPSGTYTLQVTVNPDGKYPDTNMNGNSAQTTVVID